MHAFTSLFFVGKSVVTLSQHRNNICLTSVNTDSKVVNLHSHTRSSQPSGLSPGMSFLLFYSVQLTWLIGSVLKRMQWRHNSSVRGALTAFCDNSSPANNDVANDSTSANVHTIVRGVNLGLMICLKFGISKICEDALCTMISSINKTDQNVNRWRTVAGEVSNCFLQIYAKCSQWS